MQPGDNFRAAASLFQATLTNTTQTHADANAPPERVKFTDMLTVWRKLTLEVDSMSTEPTTVSERKPDWDQIVVNSVVVNQTAGTTTLNVTSRTTIFGGLQSGETNHYEGGTLTMPGLPQPLLILDNTSNTVVADRVLSAAEIAAITGTEGTLKDDDPTSPAQFPFYPALSAFVVSAFQPAYVQITPLASLFNPNPTVVFDLNLTDSDLELGVGYDNSQDVLSTGSFWAALLVMGYQGNAIDDQDGDFDLGQNSSPRGQNLSADPYIQVGVTVEDSDNASVVFIEVLRDFGQQEGKDLDHTIAHEIGHSAGNNTPAAVDHAELGIMTTGAPNDKNSFTAPTLKRFREANPW
jgi:hypothetical protein